MADYIDRDACVKYLREIYCSKCNNYNGVRCRACEAGNIIDMIDDAPAADAEHVIRCKDCKWYERDKQKGGFCRKPEASMWSPGLPIDELKPDDYCSRAKRKENINGV